MHSSEKKNLIPKLAIDCTTEFPVDESKSLFQLLSKGNDEKTTRKSLCKRIRKKKKRIKKTKPLRTFKFYVFPFKVLVRRNSFVESNILTLFPRNLTLGIEEFLGQKNTMRETSRLSSPRLVSVLTAFPSLPPLPSRPSIFQSSCRIHFPPFLLLLLLFGSSPPFFAPANAISICR